jgi:hypothetical protein
MNMVGQLRAGRLAGSQRLDLSCGLTEFPREIFDLADTLEVLNLSGNALSTLPDDLHRLHRLRVLFCSDNQFSRLPESIGRCPQLDMVGFKANRVREVPAASLPPSLRWLILTDNLIDELPSALGQCTRLQKLMLAGNRLRALPETLAHCRSLELLRISANELDALPSWLLSMPRLAWLAFSGNPFDETPEQAALARPAAATVDWQRLTLKQKLGEGASGVIHEADWRLDDGSLRQVAVKLFKGAVTSDGWPHSEMAACIAAGVHPSLIGVLGRVENHPEGTPALVLERVNARFRNLAGAPSLQSCTRDVYGADARWSVDVALSMAGGIASATAQLHARGILHGDLYAHNILSDGRGDCLLGDFGAASFLPVDDDERSRALQRIEARAFGCLLEELLAHCDPVEASGGAGRKLLARLQERCIDPDVSARPSFDELASLLSAPSAR